jgi:glycosyltransferase involved in cell wall biosynthesis
MSEPKLGILQVSSADIGGGAEKVAWNLFRSYRTRGNLSWLAVGTKRSADPDVFVMPNHLASHGWARWWWGLSWWAQKHQGQVRGMQRFRRLAYGLAEPAALRDGWLGRENFHFPATRHLATYPAQPPAIIHAHNLHGGFFDLTALPELCRQQPLLLTPHDAWLLSGHCAHSFDCMRWQSGCGECPDLTIYPAIRRDATAENWQRKKEIYARCRLAVGTPSRWLLDKVQRSMLAPAMVEGRVIPNGIDLNSFRPGDQSEARRRLGLPAAGAVVMFAAHGIRENRWKDYTTLRRALQVLATSMINEPVIMLAVGEAAPTERIGSAEMRFVPFQPDPQVVAGYYQAADAYLHAARADTFPTTVLEALACGTPVVATAIGGIPEQVDQGETGYLTPPGDAEALAESAAAILSQPDLRRRLGGRAADVARRRFDLERQVDDYLGWYEELIGKFHAKPLP